MHRPFAQVMQCLTLISHAGFICLSSLMCEFAYSSINFSYFIYCVFCSNDTVSYSRLFPHWYPLFPHPYLRTMTQRTNIRSSTWPFSHLTSWPLSEICPRAFFNGEAVTLLAISIQIKHYWWPCAFSTTTFAYRHYFWIFT